MSGCIPAQLASRDFALCRAHLTQWQTEPLIKGSQGGVEQEPRNSKELKAAAGDVFLTMSACDARGREPGLLRLPGNSLSHALDVHGVRISTHDNGRVLIFSKERFQVLWPDNYCHRSVCEDLEGFSGGHPLRERERLLRLGHR